MLNIKDMSSLLEIVESLLRNNYKISIEPVYKDFPREKYIDYFIVEYSEKGLE